VLAPERRAGTLPAMALLLVFLMGVANFATHRAVLESGHSILTQIGWLYRSLGGR